jgi:hypothetical protein
MDMNQDDCMDDKHGKRTQQVQEGASIFLSLTCGCFLLLAVVILFEIFVFDPDDMIEKRRSPVLHNSYNIGDRPRVRRPLKAIKQMEKQDSNNTAEDDMIQSSRYQHSRVKPGPASLMVKE